MSGPLLFVGVPATMTADLGGRVPAGGEDDGAEDLLALGLDVRAAGAVVGVVLGPVQEHGDEVAERGRGRRGPPCARPRRTCRGGGGWCRARSCPGAR